ncbi:Hypothetical predicted protein [Octopus vulgaris]|uniref:DUF7041 domain-containing protein n=1 Tax=Octopus vulgaris TaxID=6645 RepID=A0AA36FJD6_OCTVU|nr:Hypothetical predicted protein [Octopus vulgaris]
MFMGSLPTFTGDVTLWFSQLETQFRAQSITPEQQLEILYGCMPPQLASSARDLITDPSPGATYASVRLEVEKRNTRSEESRFNELMADEQLGDRTPSEFLRRLRELSGEPTIFFSFSTAGELGLESIVFFFVGEPTIFSLEGEPSLATSSNVLSIFNK